MASTIALVDDDRNILTVAVGRVAVGGLCDPRLSPTAKAALKALTTILPTCRCST
jgi:hypothetical protein